MGGEEGCKNKLTANNPASSIKGSPGKVEIRDFKGMGKLSLNLLMLFWDTVHFSHVG